MARNKTHPSSSFHILPVVALLRSHYIFEFADKLYFPLFLKNLLSINSVSILLLYTKKASLSELSFVSPALDLFHNCCIPSGRMPFHYYSHKLPVYLITFSLHPSISQFFCSLVPLFLVCYFIPFNPHEILPKSHLITIFQWYIRITSPMNPIKSPWNPQSHEVLFNPINSPWNPMFPRVFPPFSLGSLYFHPWPAGLSTGGLLAGRAQSLAGLRPRQGAGDHDAWPKRQRCEFQRMDLLRKPMGKRENQGNFHFFWDFWWGFWWGLNGDWDGMEMYSMGFKSLMG